MGLLDTDPLTIPPRLVNSSFRRRRLKGRVHASRDVGRHGIVFRVPIEMLVCVLIHLVLG